MISNFKIFRKCFREIGALLFGLTAILRLFQRKNSTFRLSVVFTVA